MSLHLMRDLETLKKELLTMGSLVEEAADKAILALVNRRPELAEEVRLGDDEIDRKELDIEDKCLKTLALHQPVASDLRYIVALMKVNNALEQMGDKACNIAREGIYLSRHPALAGQFDLQKMAQSAREMVRATLDALVNQDAAMARRVCQKDSDIDEMRSEISENLRALIERDPSTVQRALVMLDAVRHLERIADLATNIAEDVIFMIEGESVRHQPDKIIGMDSEG